MGTKGGGTGRRGQIRGALILLLAAMIWGTGFVAQSAGIEKIDAFTFNGVRMFIGAFTLLCFILVKEIPRRLSMTPEDKKAARAADLAVLKGGALVGLALFGGSTTQQFAFYYADAGKIAFITALYMFFVPLFGMVLGKKVGAVTWFSVCLGFVGLYFLSINPADPFSVNRGDLLSFACAVIYAVHILLVEKFAAGADGAKLSCVQFTVCGLISVLMMFLFEKPNGGDIVSAAPALLWSGVMSCGVAFTLQVIGQKTADATAATLMMCMESVFGVLAAAILLGERMTGREILGCSVMFAAIVLSQTGDKLVEWMKKRRVRS